MHCQSIRFYALAARAVGYLAVMTCPDCGANLDEVPVGQRCPHCGGSRRDATAYPETATAHASVPRPTIGIGYEGPRSWREKWNDVLHGIEQLEGVYATKEGQGNDDVRRAVENFFRPCRELADSLWQDKSTGLNKSTVMQSVLSDPDLRLADAAANTIKHFTREGTDPITARVFYVSVGPEGASARIDWSRPSLARSYSRDALKLARKCVQAWRGFLARQGLK